MRLADLEKGLLEALATAEGDLLEDTSLIERLSETKATAAEIQVSPPDISHSIHILSPRWDFVNPIVQVVVYGPAWRVIQTSSDM